MAAGHLMGVLARRSVQFTQAQVQAQDPEQLITKLPGWGLALLAVSSLAFVFVVCTLEYSIRMVIGHLAMIEHPETTVEVHVYEPATKDDQKIAENLVDCGLIDAATLTEPTVVTKSTPLTSSIRRTKRHITSIAGEKAKWRGLGIFILYEVVVGMSSMFLRIPLRVLPFGGILAAVAAHILAARLHCAWTHKIITMPSEKSLKARMVSRAQWRELVAPTALSVVAHHLSCMSLKVVHNVSSELAVVLSEKAGGKEWIVVAGSVVPTAIMAALFGLFVMLPTYITLVRKEASLLAPEEETIVSMDRTFGGRINAIGDKLQLVDAWKSFSWEAARRLVKLYVKFFFVITAVAFVFVHVLLLEFMLVAGDDAKKILDGVKQQMRM